MINNPHCCFRAKTQYYFILNYRGVGKEVCVCVCVCVLLGGGVLGGGGNVLNKWNQGKLLKYLNMWGHSLMIIK